MCFYAKDMALDVWHSTRILEAGLPTLYTIGVTGTSHLIFMPLIARGVFDVVMKPLAQGASMQESFTLLRGFFHDKASAANAGTLAAGDPDRGRQRA
jgi:hypothetical protein